ncbi:MAG TPA: hypothetical protein VGM01_04355 [Ktedonobacteraceae bacterium]
MPAAQDLQASSLPCLPDPHLNVAALLARAGVGPQKLGRSPPTRASSAATQHSVLYFLGWGEEGTQPPKSH